MLAEFLMGVGASLTANAIDRQLQGQPNFFEKRKIASKLEEIVISVIEPIVIFFEIEKIPEDDVKRIAGEARPVVEWLIENPDFAFSRGLESELITKDILNGDAIKINLASVSDHPAAFETLLRALIDLVVKVPPVFTEWEKTAFQAMFRQTEEIKVTLASIYSMMQDITSSRKNPLGTYEKVTKHRAMTTALKMSIHGLRLSAVPQAELDSLFVFPEFSERIPSKKIEYEGTIEEVERDNSFEKFEDFYELVSTSQNCIITAPAGAGKTTFSNWLSSKLLNCSDVLFPVVLPLRKTLKDEILPGLFECVSSDISSVFKDMVDAQEISEWADKGKIVVIFEGFDEVSEGARDKVVEWIQALKAAHPNLNALITSRPLSTPHLSNLTHLGWRDIRLLPFDLPRVIVYIEHFQMHGPEILTGAKLQKPKQLAQAWNSDPTIGPLTGNPLLLSTLLVVHHMDGELPDDRSKLYDRYIDGMLGLWELNKELAAPTVPLTKEQKKKILELIAVNMISLETDAASEQDVAQWLEAYVSEQHLSNDVKGILDHLRERSGLLIGPGQYTFAHKSIGEFLVAQACNDGIQTNFQGDRFDRMLLAENCLMDRWTTVIFLWAGLASKTEAQQFITKLIDDGHTKLAGGLLLERRKFLDRQWLSEQFWRWITQCLIEGGLFSQDEVMFVHEMGSTDKMSFPEGKLQLHLLTSLNGELTTEHNAIGKFFDERICDPEDWVSQPFQLNETLWWIFSQYVEPTVEFFQAAPKTLNEEAKCFCIFDMRVSNNSGAFADDQDVRPYEPPACKSCHPFTYETFVFLSNYVRWKEGLHNAKNNNSEDEMTPALDAAEEKDIPTSGVSVTLTDLYQNNIRYLAKNGFIDRTISRPVESMPNDFFALLNDGSEDLHRRRKFMKLTTASIPETFAFRCNEALGLRVSFPMSQECDDYVANVLKRYAELGFQL